MWYLCTNCWHGRLLFYSQKCNKCNPIKMSSGSSLFFVHHVTLVPSPSDQELRSSPPRIMTFRDGSKYPSSHIFSPADTHSATASCIPWFSYVQSLRKFYAGRKDKLIISFSLRSQWGRGWEGLSLSEIHVLCCWVMAICENSIEMVRGHSFYPSTFPPIFAVWPSLFRSAFSREDVWKVPGCPELSSYVAWLCWCEFFYLV